MGPAGDSTFIDPSEGQPLTENEVLSFCREHLKEHERPASITFVEQLPRSSVGKLLRHELQRPSQPSS